jgi:5,10-methylenetetrahydromethanopterin reductase
LGRAGEIADGLHTACAYSDEALGYAVRQFKVGADRAGRDVDRLDIGDSLLGAIALDRGVALRAGRILAASISRPCHRRCPGGTALIPTRWRRSTRRLLQATSSVRLDLTPDAVADPLVVAGTPEDWVEWLTRAYAPAGLNHALVSFTDPFTLNAWANLNVAGLPDLRAQVRLFGERVLPISAETPSAQTPRSLLAHCGSAAPPLASSARPWGG